MFRFLRWLLTNKQVERRYVKAGSIFGDAVSYIYLGECIGFERLLNKWARWELEYARRGYRTLSVDAFIKHGGYGKPLESLGIKRAEGEKPILHAETYRQHFLGKISPSVNMAKLLNEDSV